MTKNERPNILWIMTDQHKFNMLSCLDGPKNITPNLDALAKDGVLFENAYTPSPVCAPARASIKTGLYPAKTGATINWVPLKESLDFLPEILQKEGYETGMAGKLHFYPVEPSYGFERKWLSDAPYSVYSDDDKHSQYIAWLKEFSFNKKGIDPVALFDGDENSYESDIKRFISGTDFRTVEEHETDWTTKRTIEFLNSRDNEKPFFFYTSYFGPHQPYYPPAPYDTLYNKDDIVLPKSFYDNKIEERPVLRSTSETILNHLHKNLTEDDYKELVALNLGQIKMIDDSIGELIAYLKDNDLYDNTNIIFASDHGDHLGEHGLFFKGQMYDSCCKVPLIIKAGKSSKGERKKEVVNMIDIYQTVLEMSGKNMTPSEDSRSLLPVIEKSAKWEDKCFSIYYQSDSILCMLRETQYKLMRHTLLDENTTFYELYDMLSDKEEIYNIWPSMQSDSKIVQLKETLDAWYEKQNKDMA